MSTRNERPEVADTLHPEALSTKEDVHTQTSLIKKVHWFADLTWNGGESAQQNVGEVHIHIQNQCKKSN